MQCIVFLLYNNNVVKIDIKRLSLSVAYTSSLSAEASSPPAASVSTETECRAPPHPLRISSFQGPSVGEAGATRTAAMWPTPETVIGSLFAVSSKGVIPGN